MPTPSGLLWFTVAVLVAWSVLSWLGVWKPVTFPVNRLTGVPYPEVSR